MSCTLSNLTFTQHVSFIRRAGYIPELDLSSDSDSDSDYENEEIIYIPSAFVGKTMTVIDFLKNTNKK